MCKKKGHLLKMIMCDKYWKEYHPMCLSTIGEEAMDPTSWICLKCAEKKKEHPWKKIRTWVFRSRSHRSLSWLLCGPSLGLRVACLFCRCIAYLFLVNLISEISWFNIHSPLQTNIHNYSGNIIENLFDKHNKT